jgi:hypothetical protein
LRFLFSLEIHFIKREKLKISYLFLVSAILLTFQIKAQQSTKSFENEHFQLDYPENWKLIDQGFRMQINIPDASFDQASVQISVTKSNMMSPPIVESMMGDLEILHYDGMDEYIGKMKSSAVTIDGQTACLVNKSDDKRTYFQYVFVMESELRIVKVAVRTGKNTFAKFEAGVDIILKSLKFKKAPAAKKRIVEATEEEFTKIWATQKAQMQGGLKDYEVTKLDSLLFDLKSPTFGFKITDTDIEINNWSDFFAWKPKTALKDYEIFAFQNWAGECLNLFRMYQHLGEYDNLRIQEMPENKLEFTFSKQNGHTIHWILEYIEKHQFPLDEDIALDRFLYTNTKGYRRAKDGKSAYHVPFLINDKVYKVKVENLRVY